MKKFIYLYCSLITCCSLSLLGCGGGYGESTNNYLSESRANTRNLLSDGSSVPPTSTPTSMPTSTPAPTSSSDPTTGVSAKPVALITNPSSDLIGFASYTASFSSSASTDDTGITRTQWYIDNVEQTQASNFTHTFAEGRYRVKLVVTDQDNQTAETSVVINAVTNGQTAENCDSGSVLMAKKLWTPFFNNCVACHQSGGFAAGTRLVLFTTSDKFYLSKNYDRVSTLLLGNSNLIRSKAQGIGHGGGAIVPSSNATVYNDLTELQKRVNTPPAACTTP